jgi:putative component of toxin-antitoxin plasmid stabilization module
LRDVIRDWLSQYKDDRPKATIQRVQQTLDTLENPSHQSIKEVYESVRVDYEKIGEVYEGDC